MYIMQMCNFYYILIVLKTLIEFGFGQNVPFVNCPEIFQYNYDGSEWFGVIDLNYGTSVKAFKLRVDMTLSQHIPKNYLGSLDLKIIRKETVGYKIKFPLPAVLPKLTEILFNEKTICYSSPDGLPTITMLELEQTDSGYISFKTNIAGVSGPVENEDTSRMNEGILYQKCGHLDEKFNEIPTDSRGTLLKRGAWPWLAAIYYSIDNNLEYKCLGTLISNRAVLTTASCITIDSNIMAPYLLGVYLGAHNLTNIEVGSRLVHRIHLHPDYQQNTGEADIALLVLSKVEFSDYIRPACIWLQSPSLENIIGETGYFAGWGTGYYTPYRAVVSIALHENCIQSNETFSNITTEGTLCAYNYHFEGPQTEYTGVGLFIRRSSEWFLRGMLSFALPYGELSSYEDNYAVYTDVAFYIEWIENTTSYE